MKKNIFFFVSIILLLSCNKEKSVYENSIVLDKQSWSWNEDLKFSFEAPDLEKKYNLYLEVENHKDYNFQNLYCKVITHFPDSTETEQILSFDLFNSRGIQNGECNKEYCKVQFVMQEDFKFEKEGLHTLTFRQHMRSFSVNHLNKFTLRLIPSSI